MCSNTKVKWVSPGHDGDVVWNTSSNLSNRKKIEPFKRARSFHFFSAVSSFMEEHFNLRKETRNFIR